jgi:hypothetical protein
MASHLSECNFPCDDYSLFSDIIILRLDSPFDLERCGPAIDLGLERINEQFLAQHKIYLNKVQAR